jgi:hypothetical protein
MVVISPDSMTVERSVSTYNILYSKLRTTTNQKTLNDRMIIAWNGVPTASYDPRPAVVSFLNKKERRNARPCLDTYKKEILLQNFLENFKLLMVLSSP